MVTIFSFETLVVTRATRWNISKTFIKIVVNFEPNWGYIHGSDECVKHAESLGAWTFLAFRNSKYQKTELFAHDLFPSADEWRETPALLHSVERAKLHHWTTNIQVLSKIWGFHGGDYEELCFLWMLRRVALVRTEVSEELSASIIRATRIGELGTTLGVTSNQRTLRSNTFFVTATASYI
jgi:hypothetical protein